MCACIEEENVDHPLRIFDGQLATKIVIAPEPNVIDIR
jgi:hypothetical protein